jgi:tetratricopeptide (TPR) repeat protein
MISFFGGIGAMRPIIACWTVLLLCAAGAYSQHDQHSSSTASEKPVALYQGLGKWSHPIATGNPAAQKYFDQGLTLLYGFNRYESLRSFRKAAELDSQAAMAYWGMAMALGPYVNMDGDPSFDIKESCAAVAKGLALEPVSGTERAWLEAAGTRCPDFAEPDRYIRAMRDLAAKVPDDPDAQALYAEALMLPTRWHWYSNDGNPARGVAEAERTLEAVLRRNPDHPGANHLYIHAVESSSTPERAIPSAQRLMGIVPAAGHMVHMPGHIWLVVGDFNNAAAVNERAAEVDRKYFADTGVMGTYYPYYLHNLQFILYARSMQGRLTETRKAERQLTEASAPMVQIMPEMAPMFSAPVVMAELRNYRWDDLISAEKPRAADPLTQALWRYSRAIALAMKGRFDDALRERAEFESLRRTLDRKGTWGTNNNIGEVMDLAAATLEARVAGSPADAVSSLRKAVAIQDTLVYDEPPAWYYPVRESLGAAMLRAGDAAGAETIFREGLRRSPNNGRMLFGLIESLKTQGKTEAAAQVRKEFDAAWKGADVELRLSDL